jgi:hypothetical protein
LFGNIDTFNNKTFLSTSGIGVGLSSSYKLAKALGGTLDITSAKKVGTSVKVTVSAFKNNIYACPIHDSSFEIDDLDSMKKDSNELSLFDHNFNMQAARDN